MDHYEAIYRGQAAAYQRMIAAEDVDGNLLAAIRRVCDLRGKILLDLGTGTGRIPLLLTGTAAQVIGVDLHRAMLEESTTMRNYYSGGWSLVQSDMRQVPVASAVFDLVTAGWAIGHMRHWFAQEWKSEIGQVLEEMHRVACHGGTLIILETLGTGTTTPAPPTKELAQYYQWLEDYWQFFRVDIQTDYQFPSVAEAVEATEFFFGPQLSDAIRRNHWTRLPEWTRMWWKTLTK